MTISLAFLAPDLVKAAIAGRLPHGMGVSRLADMPAEWSPSAFCAVRPTNYRVGRRVGCRSMAAQHAARHRRFTNRRGTVP
jgi:hypothetical protein